MIGKYDMKKALFTILAVGISAAAAAGLADDALVLPNGRRITRSMITGHRGYARSLPENTLMAFLQRVTNGGGHINREMALGQGRLDLCVEFRGARYAIEVKTSTNFKGKKSYEQCAKYLDELGLSEGWMPIFDKSKEKSWDEKIYTRDEVFNGKTIHVIGL